MLERTIRPSPVTGIKLDPVLTAILVAELLTPSPELWLVSAWVSDVTAIDGTARELVNNALAYSRFSPGDLAGLVH